MSALSNRRILLGVTGGIAAYKAAELLRQLQEQGAEVRVAMTPAAMEFITPLTFQALSGFPVHTELLDPKQEAAMGHINLSRWADAVLVAPASADFIARIASGVANDLLSTLCLASESVLMLAPAMNRAMYANPATQQNLQKLQARGVQLYGPGEGVQACGEVGPGRMLEPEQLVRQVVEFFHSGLLSGKKVLITAGPTREAIDPVRYITNHSSGKMGFAVAQAAAESGAEVTLIAGPVDLATPSGVQRVDVVSAGNMAQAVLERASAADIFIASAAVADYAPADSGSRKLKKKDSEITLKLVKTRDILATVAGMQAKPFCVGFAAETHDLETYAKGKLTAKSLDMIAANWVGKEEGGFNSDQNSLTVYWRDGQQQLESAPKLELARRLVQLIAERYDAQHSI